MSKLSAESLMWYRSQVGAIGHKQTGDLLDHIDALESENARLRMRVEAADALADAVDAYVEADSIAADRHDTRPYVTVDQLMDMGHALDAYRAANTEGE